MRARGGVAALASVVLAAACSRGVALPAPVAGQPTATTRPPVTVTLAFTGDLLAHAPITRQAAAYGASSGVAYDYGPMFADVAPVLSAADVAVCHLETPLSPDGTGLSTYPFFNVPGELATAVAGAGWDACTVASNHAYDRGADGVAATLDVLDAAGLRHDGTARTAEEATAPAVFDVRGVRVALLSYTYGIAGFSLPDDKPWMVNLIDPDRILADAAAARKSGAEVVVVAMHWGEQYVTEPTNAQRAMAQLVLGSPDVDLIVGAHAHVVQPVERIGGEYVVYGLGNFLSNQSPECCADGAQDGVIATVELVVADGGRPSAARVVVTPTWVDRSVYTVLPAATAADDPAVPEWKRAELAASWDRTMAALTSMGATGLAASDRPGPG